VAAGGITLAVLNTTDRGGQSAPAPAPEHSPSSTSTPPPPPPTPAAPTTITLRFSITPANADVFVDDKRADADSLVVTRDEGKHHIKISAVGYQPHEEDIRFDETQRLTIELEKIATKTGGKQPVKQPPPKKHPDKIESESPY
jgi:hypothetical protein